MHNIYIIRCSWYKEYKIILNEFITERENSSSVSLPFTIKTHYSYTDEYGIYENASKSFVCPFYLKKEYNGLENETKFIQFLEDFHLTFHII